MYRKDVDRLLSVNDNVTLKSVADSCALVTQWETEMRWIGEIDASWVLALAFVSLFSFPVLF